MLILELRLRKHVQLAEKIKQRGDQAETQREINGHVAFPQALDQKGKSGDAQQNPGNLVHDVGGVFRERSFL